MVIMSLLRVALVKGPTILTMIIQRQGLESVLNKKDVFACDIVIMVSPPSIEEIEMFNPNQVLISPITLPKMSEEYLACT